MINLKPFSMKTLLKTLAFLTFGILLTGCISYQHVRLSGDVELTDQSEFLFENDSLRILYSFAGYQGPIHMEIFNKLNKPFYVDMRKSALISNGKSTGLWKDVSMLNGSATEYKVNPPNAYVNSTSSINGTMVRKDHITFIPPQSKIVIDSYILRYRLFKTPEKTGEKTSFHTTSGNKRATKYSFSREDSPLNFRIFLSFGMDDTAYTPFYIDNGFWVSDYFKSHASPRLLGIQGSNQFHLIRR